MSKSLEDKIEGFLKAQFPQIQMHGGSFDIGEIDHETGEVEIFLGDACSGCGISPQTKMAIKRRMPSEIPEVSFVDIEFEGEEDITEGPF